MPTNIYQGKRARIFLARPREDGGLITYFAPPDEETDQIQAWMAKQESQEVVRALNALAYA